MRTASTWSGLEYPECDARETRWPLVDIEERLSNCKVSAFATSLGSDEICRLSW